MKKRKTIVFMGDSITDVSFNRRTPRLHSHPAYPLQIKKSLKRRGEKVNCIFSGIASNRSYHVYDRFTADCVRYSPDVVVLLIGINDFWQIFRKEEYPTVCLRPFTEHFIEILRRTRTELPNAKLLLLTPFVLPAKRTEGFLEFTAPEIEKIKLLGKSQPNTTVIDLQSVFDKALAENDVLKICTDGIHPTSLGHKYIKDAVLSVLDTVSP